MGRVRVEKLTRAKVIQLGLVFLFLGGFGYAFFRLVGFEGTSAGIASEAALVLVLELLSCNIACLMFLLILK